MSTVDDWFLTAEERGNPSTEIDRRHRDGKPYTDGNAAHVHIDGADYFTRLQEVLEGCTAGDRLLFTDWRGDGDERLDGPGTEVREVLARASRRGVDVRGLVWRSHLEKMHFSERQNRELAEVVNDAGGEVLLDERVRRVGSHHQKLVVIRHESGVAGERRTPDFAFVGGVDLGHGRRDDSRHMGDPQPINLDHHYGPRPRWHDAQLEISGPAIGDIEHTFRERWSDPAPLDHHTPWRLGLARVARQPRRPRPLPPPAPDPIIAGSVAVQVLRTYPAKTPPYPFAPDGERSVARAYLKAFARARSFIYVEDQYLWSTEVADVLCDALRRTPELHLIAVVPRHPDRDGRLSGPPYRIGQQRFIERVREAGKGRVGIFDLETSDGLPIYVHAKVCIVDDVWMSIGSDNLNRRSWTNDSELTCALIDGVRDDRPPTDPGGRGEGARRLARETRLRLWREHLGDGDSELCDPLAGFHRFRTAADALDRWHRDAMTGIRPAGRVRNHHVESVGRLASMWASAVYQVLVDPDGRPRELRARQHF
jgi:phosphatidylserine/phosphatidylglycerophosphate/cardiolipin synthase-like enzyme